MSDMKRSGFDGPAQQFARSQDMGLPYELGKVAGPHSPGKRRVPETQAIVRAVPVS